MSQSYEIEGRVKVVQDAQTFGSGFTKRELVVTVEDGKYPQDINVEYVQDKVGLLDDIGVGDEVVCTFNINGREYNGRYFNSLQGWKIFKKGGGSTAPVASDPELEDEDDVPF